MNKALTRLLNDNADESNTRHDMLTADEVEAIAKAQNVLYWAGRMRETYERRHPLSAAFDSVVPHHCGVTLRRTPPEDDLC